MSLGIRSSGPGFEEPGPLAKTVLQTTSERCLRLSSACEREGRDAKDHENRHSE